MANYCPYRFLYRSRLMLIPVLFSLLVGCSEAVSKNHPGYLPGQPGGYILSKMQRYTTPTLSDAQKIIDNAKENPRFATLLSSISNHDTSHGAKLLLLMESGMPLSDAVIGLVKNEHSEDEIAGIVDVAMDLFPLQRSQIYHALLSNSALRPTLVKKWAHSKGVLTVATYPEADENGVFIQPLIESASVTLGNVSHHTSGALYYRETGSEKWQSGRDLEWEPVKGVLTGPLVYLKPDTRYELKITLSENNHQVREVITHFQTRPDSPPIDTNKVYQLSDIYDGGTLDLEALDIEGSAKGYAKIVGNDDTVIRPGKDDKYGVYVGDNSYIYFEDVKIEGARVHAIYGEKAHHIWLNKCDISDWGRSANIIRNGIAFEKTDAKPINYDSAIYFRQSGVITVENCHVHSPNAKANDWSHGHPKGPNAFLAHANHPNPAFKGQIILRNNHFSGSTSHRFNDIIEGRKNAESLGGFVRDSAIYNNVLAYANDDAIEIDGGQQNVLVYNNDISNTYSGVSVTPVRVGPSFVFNNYIHHLGDEKGKQWASIKMGGLMTGPVGKSVILHNLITVNRNGLTASRFRSDDTFWTHAQNNLVITRKNNHMVGFNIFDPESFPGSQFNQNYLYNLSLEKPKIESDILTEYEFNEPKLNKQIAQALFVKGKSVLLPNRESTHINNFSRTTEDRKQTVIGITE